VEVLYFDIVKDFVIDSLHCLFGESGNVNKIVEVMRSSPEKWCRNPLGCWDQINRGILATKLPRIFVRQPKGITGEFKRKATENMSLAFYLLLPIASDYGTEEFLKFISNFVEGVRGIHQQNVTEQRLSELEELFVAVVKYWRKFDFESMTITIHFLLEMVDCVRNFGPCQGWHMFPHESFIGLLKNMLHGAQGLDGQVRFFLKAYQMHFKAFRLLETYIISQLTNSVIRVFTNL
jgi:hypothetical protein